MTSRVVYDSWQLLFPMIGLALFMGVFLAIVVRIWRTRKPVVDRLSLLPLADETVARGDAGLRPASGASRQDEPRPADTARHPTITSHVR